MSTLSSSSSSSSSRTDAGNLKREGGETASTRGKLGGDRPRELFPASQPWDVVVVVVVVVVVPGRNGRHQSEPFIGVASLPTLLLGEVTVEELPPGSRERRERAIV